MAGPARLTDEEIAHHIGKLTGWRREGHAIKRKIRFESFAKAIDFINRIAAHADRADHHPEIFNVYDRVELTLTTHDANGLTEKDFQLAEKINQEL